MSSITLTVQLDSQLGQELEAAARDAGQSTSDLVIRAIEEWLEDRDDEREVLAILARNEPSSSSADVRRRLGLEG
jgi:metal-responsive CopG/Arc/MetJ family transcriptional regulator